MVWKVTSIGLQVHRASTWFIYLVSYDVSKKDIIKESISNLSKFENNLISSLPKRKLEVKFEHGVQVVQGLARFPSRGESRVISLF